MADPCNAVCNFVDLSGKPDAVIPVNLPAVTSVPVAGNRQHHLRYEREGEREREGGRKREGTLL